MPCINFPDCWSGEFTPGEKTADGKRTYRTVCAAGVQGCNGLGYDEIQQFDATHSRGNTPRLEPVWVALDGFRTAGPGWKSPDALDSRGLFPTRRPRG